jgi:Flp pilus assembly protein TadG
MEREVMKGLRDERGQVMVLTVLCMAVLFGFVAFAVDVGMLLRAKRVMQTAADSGAIAAAAEYNNGDMVAAAQADAAQNGVTNGANGATVVVNNPPVYGSYAGIPNASNYVEVIVSQPQTTFFMSLFNRNSMTVAARAVATMLPAPNCVYTMDQTPGDGAGIFLSNGTHLLAQTCGVLDDATSTTDNPGTIGISALPGTSILAKSVGVVGSVNTYGDGSISPSPITGISPVNDPLSYLTPPTYDPSTCIGDPAISGGSGQSAGPPSGGTICYNGLTITTSGAGNTLMPGLYIINGPMTFYGTGTISGTGVTFYFPPGAGSFSIAPNNNITLLLTAPTSGPYNGILFYQNPQDSQPMSFTSNSSWSLSGIFYLPSAPLSMIGSGPSTFNASFVVGSLSLSSNVFNLTPYVSPYLTSPLSTPRLVE